MRGFATAGVSPNVVTSLAVFGSLLVGLAVAFAGRRPILLLLLPIWLFVRMALSAIDGMMAHELDKATRLGGALNEVGDVVSDLALYMPLALVNPRSGWPVIGFAIAGVLSEFCGVLGVALGSTRRYDGPMGKSDRAFTVSALALVTFVFPAAVWYWPVVFCVAAAACALTCWNRVRRALA